MTKFIKILPKIGAVLLITGPPLLASNLLSTYEIVEVKKPACKTYNDNEKLSGTFKKRDKEKYCSKKNVPDIHSDANKYVSILDYHKIGEKWVKIEESCVSKKKHRRNLHDRKVELRSVIKKCLLWRLSAMN